MSAGICLSCDCRYCWRSSVLLLYTSLVVELNPVTWCEFAPWGLWHLIPGLSAMSLRSGAGHGWVIFDWEDECTPMKWSTATKYFQFIVYCECSNKRLLWNWDCLHCLTQTLLLIYQTFKSCINKIMNDSKLSAFALRVVNIAMHDVTSRGNNVFELRSTFFFQKFVQSLE